jgi:hypothetical protein
MQQEMHQMRFLRNFLKFLSGCLHGSARALPILRDATLRAAPQDEGIGYLGQPRPEEPRKARRLEGWATTRKRADHRASLSALARITYYGLYIA